MAASTTHYRPASPPLPRVARWPRWLTVSVAATVVLLVAPVRPATADPANASAGTGRVLAGRIAAGAFHTCAVLDGGAVRCWGSGISGRLGYGNARNVGDGVGPDVADVGPVDFGAGHTASAITAGNDHTCALLDDATVRCWGDASFGKLGYGNTQDVGDGVGPDVADVGRVLLTAGRTVTAISAGSSHTCALLDDATVRCWGLGSSGQLGYGDDNTVGDNETPAGALPVGLGAGRTATAITAGGGHTCALLDDATVRCWGEGFDGSLGYGNTQDVGDGVGPDVADVGPVDLGAGRTAIAITAGSNHTCAVLDTGAVRCWGSGDNGRLGYGSTQDVGDGVGPDVADVGPVDLGAHRTATAVTAAGGHTCAMLDNGRVRCWGFGERGPLGYGNTENVGDGVGLDVADAGSVDLGAGRTASGIAADNTHTCAVLDDGSIVCWGEGSSGQLGYGDTFRIGDDETPGFAGPVAVGGLVSSSPPSPPGDGDGFTPVSPVRVLDTRVGLGAVGPLAAEATLALSVPGVPTEATAVVLNVTVTEPDRAGFLTVWPCGPARPLASNLNFAAAEDRANLVVASRGRAGRVCFGGNVTTHVVADLAGWYAPADGTNARYNPLTPARLVDTRTGGPAMPGAPLVVTVAGGPVPADARAVMLNVTAVGPAAPGFLTVWPCDEPQPQVSNLNYTTGQIVANAAVVKTSAAGTVCVATLATADVAVDRVGWFGTTGDVYEPLEPVRVLDTRTGTGAPAGKLVADTRLTLTIPGLPADATAVVVNVTATEPDTDGFVTVWPCGQRRPLASTLNVVAGQLAVSNLAVVALGPGDRICLAGNTTTHLIVDLDGNYHPSAGPP